MKIALLTDGIFPSTIGGIQKHSYMLAKHWAKAGIMVHIYHPEIIEVSKLVDYYTGEELQNISFHQIKKPKVKMFLGHYIYQSYLFSKKLYNVINLKSYDAIYSQGFTGWYTSNTSLNYKLICNLHGLEMYQHAVNIKNKLEHLLLRIPASIIIKKAKKQISLGGKLTEILYTQGATKGTVVEIPNGIDTSFIRSTLNGNNNASNLMINKESIRFIFIGRYERRKSIEEINQAISKLTKQGFNIICDFIGPIPEEKQIKNNVNITYHGKIINQNQIKDRLSKSDILLCPSYSEGMPTVILEAMAQGCAIITTDVGANSIMVDKTNGWLINPKNIQNELTKTINIALNTSQKQINEMGESSVNKIKQSFTWEKVIQKTIKEINIHRN
ncbi:glycosyltransferase family 4 protein [Flammeovirga pacifica]|uniref:Glycosyl transferase family 1 domain-containing protein n=1 Tax=Flammeovirga pacifica TaxID=915059 RepID=A0A1S1YV90_FLAPC|nr:glycosyltransferase family 4 protein [Flammeovirga pacifica]OHX64936.1 hypothetical protein NH26_00530 [Flammeovirga pacifica]